MTIVDPDQPDTAKSHTQPHTLFDGHQISTLGWHRWPSVASADITPDAAEIDWIGNTPRPVLDPPTQRTLDLLNAAVDARLDAMPVDVPMVNVEPSPDPVTDEILALGTDAMLVTKDPLAADVLHQLCLHVVTLREQIETSQLVASAVLAQLNRDHNRAQREREARRG